MNKYQKVIDKMVRYDYSGLKFTSYAAERRSIKSFIKENKYNFEDVLGWKDFRKELYFGKKIK